MSLVDKIKSLFGQKERGNSAAITSPVAVVAEPIREVLPVNGSNGNFVYHNGVGISARGEIGNLSERDVIDNISGGNETSQDPANEQERADFLNKLGIVLNLVAEHPLELNIGDPSLGYLYHNPYREAEELAWRGKDPREALAAVHSSSKSLELDLFSDKIPDNLVQQFRDYVLRKTAKIMQRPWMNYSSFEMQRIYQSLSEQEREGIRELLKDAYSKFIKSPSVRGEPLSPKRENRILRTYDSRRYENNIPRLLKEASTKARAGDVRKTLEELAKVEKKAAGDWTKEIFEIYKLAYRVNFESAINKAEREFVKQRPEKGMKYLKQAELYAQEIGIPLKADNPSSLRSQLNPKAFVNYQQYMDMQKERIDLQRERTKVLYSITAHCQSKEGVN